MRDYISITNPNVYGCSDLDSESDTDDYFTIINTHKRRMSVNQEQNLVKLGCSHNLLDEFKRLNLVQNPNCIDEQYDLKQQQHELDLQKERDIILKSQRQKIEETSRKYKAMMSQLESKSLLDDDAQDKEFEAKLKAQKKSIDDAIALDKKKSEAESAEAKAKADKIKKEADEKAQKAAKEKAEKEEAESKSKLEQSSSTSLKGLEEYQKHFEKIEHFRKNIRPKLQDPALSKLCFMVQKTINRSTGQLQSDRQTIMVKYNIVYECLMSTKTKSTDAFEVLLNYLAKVILRLVRKEGVPAAYTVYYLARYSYLLCATVPEFIDYLLARLMKRCPYLIPQYHDDNPTLPQSEALAKRRYVLSDKENKVMETFLEHAGAQECYVKFYGALCQTLPDPGQPENIYPIKHAWIYLARICNMPLRDITPFLIVGILDVAGQSLLMAYPHQLPKLFRLIQKVIMPGFPNKENPNVIAAIERLQIILDSYFNTGKVQCLEETVTFSNRK